MTTMTTKTIANAIRESVQTNRVVDIAVYTDAQLDAVICEADDYADETNDTLDVWGTTDEGNEWRLRVAKRLYDADACKSLLSEAEGARDWDLARICNIALGYVDGNAEFARARVARVIDEARSNRD